jgi:hypothetical protein
MSVGLKHGFLKGLVLHTKSQLVPHTPEGQDDFAEAWCDT